MAEESIELENDIVNKSEEEAPNVGKTADPEPGDDPAPESEETKMYTKEEVRKIVKDKLKDDSEGERYPKKEFSKEEEISDEEQKRRTKAFRKLIVVTGGAGFIGSHLIKELNNQGREDILLVDDLTDPRKLHNIKTLEFQDYVDKSKFIELLGFLLENKMVERIYHLGAESSRHNTDGKYMMENNYQYTCNIMDLCYLNKIPLVFASSAAVYGQRPDANDASDDYTPESYYALSKLQADRYFRKFEFDDQTKILGLRYFNVFSDGEFEQHKDEGKSALCWMSEQYKKDGVIKLFKGSKELFRDFVHVKDAVWMTINAMKKGRSGIYNIGTGTPKSFYDMAADVLEKEFSTDESNIKFISMPDNIAQGYQKFTQANMDNACFSIITRP
jgi:ADP-L-glycero-D-manno-heptose 6-epimerase